MAASKAGANDEYKIFIGGLHRDTTEDNLKEHFSKYGKVADSVVKRDPVTGNSRGFGFVQFEDMASIDLAMSEPKHILQGKQVDPKRAKAKSETMTRIFVGGLDPNMPEEEVREYFGQYGKIENIEMPFDKERNARRGFCFVTYESTDSVRSVTGMGKHTVGNRQVDVKVAQPKDMSYMRGGRGGGSRGAFNGRGGYGGMQGGYGGPPAYGGGYGGAGGYGGPQAGYGGAYGPSQGGYGGAYGAGDYGAYAGAPQGGYYPAANGVSGYGSYGGDAFQGYPPAQPSGSHGWYNSAPAHNGAGYGRGKGADRYAPY